MNGNKSTCIRRKEAKIISTKSISEEEEDQLRYTNMNGKHALKEEKDEKVKKLNNINEKSGTYVNRNSGKKMNTDKCENSIVKGTNSKGKCSPKFVANSMRKSGGSTITRDGNVTTAIRNRVLMNVSATIKENEQKGTKVTSTNSPRSLNKQPQRNQSNVSSCRHSKGALSVNSSRSMNPRDLPKFQDILNCIALAASSLSKAYDETAGAQNELSMDGSSSYRGSVAKVIKALNIRSDHDMKRKNESNAEMTTKEGTSILELETFESCVNKENNVEKKPSFLSIPEGESKLTVGEDTLPRKNTTTFIVGLSSQESLRDSTEKSMEYIKTKSDITTRPIVPPIIINISVNSVPSPNVKVYGSTTNTEIKDSLRIREVEKFKDCNFIYQKSSHHDDERINQEPKNDNKNIHSSSRVYLRSEMKSQRITEMQTNTFQERRADGTTRKRRVDVNRNETNIPLDNSASQKWNREEDSDIRKNCSNNKVNNIVQKIKIPSRLDPSVANDKVEKLKTYDPNYKECENIKLINKYPEYWEEDENNNKMMDCQYSSRKSLLRNCLEEDYWSCSDEDSKTHCHQSKMKAYPGHRSRPLFGHHVINTLIKPIYCGKSFYRWMKGDTRKQSYLTKAKELCKSVITSSALLILGAATTHLPYSPREQDINNFYKKECLRRRKQRRRNNVYALSSEMSLVENIHKYEDGGKLSSSNETSSDWIFSESKGLEETRSDKNQQMKSVSSKCPSKKHLQKKLDSVKSIADTEELISVNEQDKDKESERSEQEIRHELKAHSFPSCSKYQSFPELLMNLWIPPDAEEDTHPNENDTKKPIKYHTLKNPSILRSLVDYFLNPEDVYCDNCYAEQEKNEDNGNDGDNTEKDKELENIHADKDLKLNESHYEASTKKDTANKETLVGNKSNKVKIYYEKITQTESRDASNSESISKTDSSMKIFSSVENCKNTCEEVDSRRDIFYSNERVYSNTSSSNNNRKISVDKIEKVIRKTDYREEFEKKILQDNNVVDPHQTFANRLQKEFVFTLYNIVRGFSEKEEQEGNVNDPIRRAENQCTNHSKFEGVRELGESENNEPVFCNQMGENQHSFYSTREGSENSHISVNHDLNGRLQNILSSYESKKKSSQSGSSKEYNLQTAANSRCPYHQPGPSNVKPVEITKLPSVSQMRPYSIKKTRTPSSTIPSLFRNESGGENTIELEPSFSNTRRKRSEKLNSAEVPYPGYPVNITKVVRLGNESVFVKWDIINSTNLSGIKIFVNKILKSRIYTTDQYSACLTGIAMDEINTIVLCPLRQTIYNEGIHTMGRSESENSKLSPIAYPALTSHIGFDLLPITWNLSIYVDTPSLMYNYNPEIVTKDTGGYPVHIQKVQCLGSQTLLIKWKIIKDFLLSGYEIIIDNKKKFRIHSKFLDSFCVTDVNINEKHVIILYPILNVNEQREIELEQNRHGVLSYLPSFLSETLNMENDYVRTVCLDSWRPSIYLYDPPTRD